MRKFMIERNIPCCFSLRTGLLSAGIRPFPVRAASPRPVPGDWEGIQSWYAFWRDFESLGKNAQRRAEYRHRETGIVFVGLPGGTFLMGSPETESEREEWEGPVHKVTRRFEAGSSDPREDRSWV